MQGKSAQIAMVVAMSSNRVIGNHNQLPWHLPADLQHFKALTTGHAIVMGRKTFLSIGRPLPNRTNIVITHDLTFKAEGILVSHSLKAALSEARAVSDPIFVIGGAVVFEQCLAVANRIYLTLIHQYFDGDTFFPLLNESEWQQTTQEDHPADGKNPYPYSFITLDRCTSP